VNILRNLSRKSRVKANSLLIVAMVLALVGAGGAFTTAMAVVDPATPSTNEANQEKGWAHFNVVETRVGEVDIEFVSTRGFASCFEYRADGEASPYTTSNYNSAIKDGLWPFVCTNNSIANRTLTAEEFVEIRMVFGAERDERFSWTKVDVETQPEVTIELAKAWFDVDGNLVDGIPADLGDWTLEMYQSAADPADEVTVASLPGENNSFAFEANARYGVREDAPEGWQPVACDTVDAHNIDRVADNTSSISVSLGAPDGTFGATTAGIHLVCNQEVEEEDDKDDKKPVPVVSTKKEDDKNKEVAPREVTQVVAPVGAVDAGVGAVAHVAGLFASLTAVGAGLVSRKLKL
jgi:hypothetical protein